MVAAKKIPSEVDNEDAKAVLAIVANESDRGCALVIAEWLSEALRELIGASLVVQANQTEIFNGPTTPLGTFSSRVRIAHALGLLEKSEHEALNAIRQVRNKAAHFDKAVGFDFRLNQASVVDSLKPLEMLPSSIRKSVAKQPNPARLHFCLLGAVLIGRLYARTKKAHALEPRTPTNWDAYWKQALVDLGPKND